MGDFFSGGGGMMGGLGDMFGGGGASAGGMSPLTGYGDSGMNVFDPSTFSGSDPSMGGLDQGGLLSSIGGDGAFSGPPSDGGGGATGGVGGTQSTPPAPSGGGGGGGGGGSSTASGGSQSPPLTSAQMGQALMRGTPFGSPGLVSGPQGWTVPTDQSPQSRINAGFGQLPPGAGGQPVQTQAVTADQQPQQQIPGSQPTQPPTLQQPPDTGAKPVQTTPVKPEDQPQQPIPGSQPTTPPAATKPEEPTVEKPGPQGGPTAGRPPPNPFQIMGDILRGIMTGNFGSLASDLGLMSGGQAQPWQGKPWAPGYGPSTGVYNVNPNTERQFAPYGRDNAGNPLDKNGQPQQPRPNDPNHPNNKPPGVTGRPESEIRKADVPNAQHPGSWVINPNFDPNKPDTGYSGANPRYIADPNAGPQPKPDGTGTKSATGSEGTTTKAPPAVQGYGARPDQTGRPYRMSGNLSLGGHQYNFTSGGGDYASLPYGHYHITTDPSSVGDVGHGLTRHGFVGNAIAGVSDNPTGNTVNEADALRHGARDGIEIHPLRYSGGNTNGCIGIDPKQWGQFTQDFNDARANGQNLTMDVTPQGITIQAEGAAGPNAAPSAQQPVTPDNPDSRYQTADAHDGRNGGGTLGDRNNNPGNIKGRGYPGQAGNDGQGHAIFNSWGDGRRAQAALLQRKYNNMTVPEMGGGGKGYAEDPGWARGVMKAGGFSPNEKLDLNDPQTLDRLQRAIWTQEGTHIPGGAPVEAQRPPATPSFTAPGNMGSLQSPNLMQLASSTMSDVPPSGTTGGWDNDLTPNERVRQGFGSPPEVAGSEQIRTDSAFGGPPFFGKGGSSGGGGATSHPTPEDPPPQQGRPVVNIPRRTQPPRPSDQDQPRPPAKKPPAAPSKRARPKGMPPRMRKHITARRQSAPPQPKLSPYGGPASTTGYVQPGERGYEQAYRYYYGRNP